MILLVKVHAFMTTKLDELNIIYWEQYVILLVKAHCLHDNKTRWAQHYLLRTVCDPPGQGTCLHDNKTRRAKHYLVRTVCDPPGQGTCLHDNKCILSYLILLVNAHSLHDIKTRCAEHYLLRTVCDPPGQGTHAFMTNKTRWAKHYLLRTVMWSSWTRHMPSWQQN